MAVTISKARKGRDGGVTDHFASMNRNEFFLKIQFSNSNYATYLLLQLNCTINHTYFFFLYNIYQYLIAKKKVT